MSISKSLIEHLAAHERQDPEEPCGECLSLLEKLAYSNKRTRFFCFVCKMKRFALLNNEGDWQCAACHSLVGLEYLYESWSEQLIEQRIEDARN